MSNSIWKKPDQKPDLYKILVIKTNKGNAYTNILTNEKDWVPILLPSFYDIGDIDKAERITLYAYLDDLITKAERLEQAVKYLKRLHIKTIEKYNPKEKELAEQTIDYAIEMAIEQKDKK